MSHPLMISGESLDSLLRFLPYLKTDRARDGRVQVTAEVPSEIATPMFRALMRTEARLLIEDADEMKDADWEPRTPEERRCDAFVSLITSVGAASRYQRHEGGSHDVPPPA